MPTSSQAASRVPRPPSPSSRARPREGADEVADTPEWIDQLFSITLSVRHVRLQHAGIGALAVLLSPHGACPDSHGAGTRTEFDPAAQCLTAKGVAQQPRHGSVHVQVRPKRRNWRPPRPQPWARSAALTQACRLMRYGSGHGGGLAWSFCYHLRLHLQLTQNSRPDDWSARLPAKSCHHTDVASSSATPRAIHEHQAVSGVPGKAIEAWSRLAVKDRREPHRQPHRPARLQLSQVLQRSAEETQHQTAHDRG